MKKQYLEAGKIVNTHGVRGEVKIEVWANSPEFLADFKTLRLDGAPVKVLSARVHKDAVIASLEGVDTMDRAVSLRGKVVFIDRADAKLAPGQVFYQDIIGLSAIDEEGNALGTVTDVEERPANDFYVIQGEREILVPAVPEFVKEIDPDAGFIRLHLIEGM